MGEPQTGLVSDHVGVLGIGLALAAVALGGPADQPAWHVDDLLVVPGQCQQQPGGQRGPIGQIDRLHHRVGRGGVLGHGGERR